MAGIDTSDMSFDVHTYYLSITHHSLRLSSLLASTTTRCCLYLKEGNETYLANTGTARVCKNDNADVL